MNESRSTLSSGVSDLPVMPESTRPQALRNVGTWLVIREVFTPLFGPLMTSKSHLRPSPYSLLVG